VCERKTRLLPSRTQLTFAETDARYQWRYVTALLLELHKVLPDDVNNALMLHPNKVIRFTAQVWKGKVAMDSTEVFNQYAVDDYVNYVRLKIFCDLFESLSDVALDILCSLPNSHRGSVLIPGLKHWRRTRSN
jgi:hypothetical protein